MKSPHSGSGSAGSGSAKEMLEVHSTKIDKANGAIAQAVCDVAILSISISISISIKFCQGHLQIFS